MRTKMMTLMLAALAASACGAATKAFQGMSYSTSAVKAGVWSTKFYKQMAYAEKHGRPLVTLFINTTCGNCQAACRSIAGSSDFTNWQKSSGYVYAFSKITNYVSGDTEEGYVYFDLMMGANPDLNYFPWCCVYLKQIGSSKPAVYKAFEARGMSASQLKSKINGYLKKYVYIKTKAESGGKVKKSGFRKIGKSVTIKATPDSGRKFKGWYDSKGKRVSTSASYKFTVQKKVTYTAKFK